jgi:hypothetical protein
MVEQNTRSRIMKTGLTAYNESKTFPGYILYTPLNGDTTILIDHKGNTKHTWKHNYRGNYGYLLPNGNLFMNGKTKDKTWDLLPGWNNFKGGILQELAPQGNIIWEHRDPYQHHDGRRTTNGGTIYLSLEKLSKETASKVKGGIPDSDKEGMWADKIVELDNEGDTVWSWSAAEHLDFETDILPSNFTRSEWSHGNTVVPIGEDKVMVSFRSISVVGLIDKPSGEFDWKIGPDTLAQQHDPSLLNNGNVLVFDNGLLKRYSSKTFSRVIEIDPNSMEIVWEYCEEPYYNFYSPHISGARRLPNGNTLVIEGAFGRMFQVTGEGEIVWEYINPFFVESLSGYTANTVFRANHYMKQEIPFI